MSRSGCVRVPGRSARRSIGGPDQRSGVGAVAAHDRPAAVIGVGVLRVSRRQRGHDGRVEPGATRAVDETAGRPSGPGRCRWSRARGRCRRSWRQRGAVVGVSTSHSPGSGDVLGDGARRPAPLRGPRSATERPVGRRSSRVRRRRQGRPSTNRVDVRRFFTAVGTTSTGTPTRLRHRPRVRGAEGPRRGQPLTLPDWTRSSPAHDTRRVWTRLRVTNSATRV